MKFNKSEQWEVNFLYLFPKKKQKELLISLHMNYKKNNQTQIKKKLFSF